MTDFGRGQLIICQVDEFAPTIAFKTEKGDIYKIDNLRTASIRKGRPTRSYAYGPRFEEIRDIEHEPDVIELEADLTFKQRIQTFVDVEIIEEQTVFLLEPGETPALTCGVGWPD